MQTPDFSQASYDTPPFTLKGYTTIGRLVDCYDGDTMQVVLPFLDKMFKFTIRMYGVDTCEMKSKDTENKERAMQARKRVLQLATQIESLPDFKSRKEIQKYLATNETLVFLDCMEMDKYGRVLAKVYKNCNDTECFGDILIHEKLAYAYYGDTKLTEKEQTQSLA
jgi:endonuclease YncB( thermonuclease family)